MRREIVIAGFGGQGVQSSGKLLAKVLDNKGFLVSLRSNYGPEARGGKSFSEVVIKESQDDWPEILQVDVLLAMSQDGYDSWISRVSEEGCAVYDADMVKPASASRVRQFPVPATKVASDIGSKIAANMVMLGAMAAITGLCSAEDFSQTENHSDQFSATRQKAIGEGYRLGSLVRNLV